jgi:hypothetical protein
MHTQITVIERDEAFETAAERRLRERIKVLEACSEALAADWAAAAALPENFIELPAPLFADLHAMWERLNHDYPAWHPTFAAFIVEALKDKAYGSVYAPKHFPEVEA